MKYNELLTESFGKPYKLEWDGSKAHFQTDDGIDYTISFEKNLGNSYHIIFRSDSGGFSHAGLEIRKSGIKKTIIQKHPKNVNKVYATAMLAIEVWIEQEKPKKLLFGTAGTKLSKLYNAFVSNQAIQEKIASLGYKFFKRKRGGWVIKRKLGLW